MTASHIKSGSDLRVLRIEDVKLRTGISRSGIYDRMKVSSPYYDPTFPTQRKLGQSAVGWLEADIEAWIDGRFNKEPSGTQNRKMKVVTPSAIEDEQTLQKPPQCVDVEKSSVTDHTSHQSLHARITKIQTPNGPTFQVSRKKRIWLNSKGKIVENS